MSYKTQKLQEIMQELTHLRVNGAIDSMRVEVVVNGERQVFYTDSTMLHRHEYPETFKPALRVVT